MPRNDLAAAPLTRDSSLSPRPANWIRPATVLALAIQGAALAIGLVVALGSGPQLAADRAIHPVEDLGLLFTVVWPIGAILAAHQWGERRRFLYLHLAGAPVFLGVVLYSLHVLGERF